MIKHLPWNTYFVFQIDTYSTTWNTNILVFHFAFYIPKHGISVYFVFHCRFTISDIFQRCIWIHFLWMVCITFSVTSSLGTCNFEVDTCDWSNTQTGDEIDWLQHSGSTGNANTGPALDHTTGTTSGWYMYIDSARGGQGSRARFESSSIDATNGVSCFTMWYHIVSSSSNYGTINVSTFRTKTQNIYSQEEINLYCIIKLAT